MAAALSDLSKRFLFYKLCSINKLRFLIDTGAAISIIPRGSISLPLIPGNMQLVAANGSRIHFYGFVDLWIDVGLPKRFKHRFAVCNASVPILGADFIVRNSLIIDMCSAMLLEKKSLSPVMSIQDNLTAPVSEAVIRKECQSLLEAELSVAPSHGVTHCIETTGFPLFSKYRRVTPEKLEVIRSYVEDMLSQGILRPSKSPWSSPVHLVPKKEGGWRTCGDYRRLNAATVPDRYPLPHISDLLDKTSGKTCFTNLDLTKAYYQVPMSEADISKTAIATPLGLFEYTRMPFGLRNAGCTFQRLLDNLFRNIPDVLVYLDDILIASDSWDAHWMTVRKVLAVCESAGLVLNVAKCKFGVTEIEFLGHTVSVEGVVPLLKKFELIDLSLPPTDKKSLPVSYTHLTLPTNREV